MGLFDFIEDEEARTKAEEAHTSALTTTVDELVTTKIDGVTSGLKAKNDELLAEKKKIASTLKNFENLDPEKAREALKFLEENENARLLKEGKIDELLAKQTSQMKEDHESVLTELNKKLGESNVNADTYKGLFEKKVIEDSIREAAIKAGVRPEALQDVLYRGGSVFTLGEDTKVEARGEDGKLLMTADDILVTPENWIEGLKKSAPHYWPGSEGAGGLGGEGTGAGDDLTAAMADAAKKNDMPRYRALRAKQKKIAAAA